MTDEAVIEQAANGDTPADEETPVSHGDIAAAWDKAQADSETAVTPVEEEVVEEEVVVYPEPEPEPEPVPVEEEPDHGEKSRLGRKFKRLEDTLKERDKQIEDLRSGVDRLTGHIEALSGNAEPAVEEDIDPTQILTYGDLQRLQEQERKQAEARLKETEDSRTQYATGYYAAVDALEETEPEHFAVLYKMLTDDDGEFNRKVTGNPAVDVRINAGDAIRKLLQEDSGSKPKPKLKQEEAKGTKVGDTDKVTEKAPKQVNIDTLDEDSKNFLRRMESKGEDVQALADRALGEKSR